jgi:ribulose-phosphate 3-epimerase
MIAASLLSADFADLKGEIRSVEQGGADWLHLDVMDGHFVPNLTFGPLLVEAVKRLSRLPLDVHLMITDPLKYAPEFIRAGADWLTIHSETTAELVSTIRKVKSLGAKAGVSLNPGTPLERISSAVSEADLVLVMSVNPGFGGQKFMPEVLNKVRGLNEMMKHGAGLISIDGGINPETATLAREAGAGVLVAGAAIFTQADRAARIRELRGE